MRDLIAARTWLTVIRLPAYAPDLNPAEGVWRWMKRGLTNIAARSVAQQEEAAVVREIFNLYTVRRIGTRAVANELTRRGYRSRSGRPWSAKTVTDTLRNPAYLGTVAFRDVRAEDAHLPIIDRETFTAAGTLLAERGANTAKAVGVASGYHLTGKIFCPKCGKQYVGTTATGRSRTYRYYNPQPVRQEVL